jgi:hypothetical protein
MKKIMMSKYGFVRWPEEDFSDDGNRFTCYRAGKAVRVSKLVADGDAYLSIDSSVGKGTLPYEVYSTLPNYKKAVWGYNGVSLSTLTDEDLKDFYNACISYEKEYEEAEASVVYPTLEELKIKAEQVTIKVAREVNQVEKLLSLYAFEAASKFSKYDWINLQEYIGHLNSELIRFNPDTYPQKIVGSAGSFNFIKNKSYLEEGFWFKCIIDLFKDKGMSVSKD